MTIRILRPTGSRAHVGFVDRGGQLPIGDEAIPYILRDLVGFPLIPVVLPLVLPIQDGVRKAGLCFCKKKSVFTLSLIANDIATFAERNKILKIFKYLINYLK